MSGLDSPTLLITGLKPEDAGKYRCLVINTAGVAQSKEATLTVGKKLIKNVYIIIFQKSRFIQYVELHV